MQLAQVGLRKAGIAADEVERQLHLGGVAVRIVADGAERGTVRVWRADREARLAAVDVVRHLQLHGRLVVHRKELHFAGLDARHRAVGAAVRRNVPGRRGLEALVGDGRVAADGLLAGDGRAVCVRRLRDRGDVLAALAGVRVVFHIRDARARGFEPGGSEVNGFIAVRIVVRAEIHDALGKLLALELPAVGRGVVRCVEVGLDLKLYHDAHALVEHDGLVDLPDKLAHRRVRHLRLGKRRAEEAAHAREHRRRLALLAGVEVLQFGVMRDVCIFFRRRSPVFVFRMLRVVGRDVLPQDLRVAPGQIAGRGGLRRRQARYRGGGRVAVIIFDAAVRV